jgi:tetratricopeptide (TPR) repeat protein
LNARVHLQLGQALANQTHVEAEMHLRRAVELEPSLAKNHFTYGRVLELAGNKAEAEHEYLEALALDPHSPFLLLEIARHYQALGNEQKAFDYYRRLIDLEKTPYETLKGVRELIEPAYAYAHYEMGMRYMRAGNQRAAAQEFKATIARLEERLKYRQFVEAAHAGGLVSPQDENALKDLLRSAKRQLAGVTGS